MHIARKLLLAPALVLAAACGRDDGAPPVDDALKNDLALAAAVQPYQAQQFVSPMEQGYAGQYAPQYAPQYPPQYAPQPYGAPGVYAAPAPAPVRRTQARTVSTASSGRIYRAPAPAPAPSAPVIKNTKRDAAIGAVAGAAIGVATSARKDRLKGGLLGAVAGAAVGAVIGNNVDVQRP
jgi:hypothetical protein